MQYGNYRKPTQPQTAQQTNQLTEDQIEEFKTYIETLNKKIEERYGAVKSQDRLNVEKFKEAIAAVGKCKAEGILTITENRTKKIVYFKKVVFNNENSGEDALASFNVEINERLKIPWMRRITLFDYPLQIIIRDNGDKKCIEMAHNFVHPKFTAGIRLIIREKII